MYQVVLVDDDRLVIEFMEKMIPWEAIGFEVIASFHDSFKAYDFLVGNQYDVLITDIGMPHMNGIELISQLKEKQNSPYNVILSCHDEFDFAQKALKLEVYDYILKESMEEEHIIELLQRLKQSLIESDQNKHYQIKVERFLKQNNMSLKSKFMEKIIHEPYMNDEHWWQEQEEFLNMDFSSEQYTVVLSFIDHYEQTIAHYETEALLQFSINNIVKEVLTDYRHNLQIFYLQKKFFILFPTKNNKQLNLHVIEKIMEKTYNRLNNYLKISVTSIIHKGSHEKKGLVESVKALIKNEEQRFYYPAGSIQFFQRMSYGTASIFQQYTEEVRSLKTYIMKEDYEQVHIYISKKLDNIKQEQFAPKVVKDWAMKLILDIKLSLNALAYFEDLDFNTITSRELQGVENFEALETTIQEICQRFIHRVNEIEAMSHNEYVVKAQRFVRCHLEEKISLKDIAEFVHLNPSYFSRMFKKETGEGFIEYVTRMKMEKAKELLDNTTKSVEQIAIELSFDSKSYFLKTFKKQIGMSPNAYKYKNELAEH